MNTRGTAVIAAARWKSHLAGASRVGLLANRTGRAPLPRVSANMLPMYKHKTPSWRRVSAFRILYFVHPAGRVTQAFRPLSSFQNRDAGQFEAGEELERRSSARGDVADLAGDAR